MKYLIENDQMYIDGSKAWFVDRNTNELMTMDIDTGKCTYKVQIPITAEDAFRCNPFIYVYEQKVFLLPNYGRKVWLFDAEEEKLYEIEVINKDKVAIQTSAKWVYNKRLYFVSRGLRKLVVIDILTKKVEKYVDVFDTIEIFSYGFERVENIVYLASRTTNIILEYNLESEVVKYYNIPCIRNGLGTICFDGKVFWLSGCEKKICKWNKEDNTVTTFENFPDDFCVYDRTNIPVRTYNEKDVMPFPIFLNSILLKNKILFIPWNIPQVYVQKLICMNLQDNTMTSVKITDNERCAMYTYEYIRNNVLVGVLSSENTHITEINIESLDKMQREMYIDEKCLECKHENELILQSHYNELVESDIKYLISKTITNYKYNEYKEDNIGKQIFQRTSR